MILSPAEVMTAHRQIASEFGNQADRIVAEARERRQSQAQERPVAERRQQAHSALTFARDRSFEREAVMDERALFVDPTQKHLYMVDESSLASTQQMRDFLNKIGPQDKALLIGDTRQHQGVDAGKPFEQLQQAGMQTAKLDQIVRQKDPELLKAVEHLSKNETTLGVQMLQQQGRVTEIVDPQQRIEAIAKSYAARPENTIIVSPDNASRRAINQAVRQELQALGTLDKEDHSMRVLTPRSDMTGADRAWAARYQAGDVLRYVRGSKELGIGAGSYAQVVASDPKENLVTVQTPDGERVSYDPSRLRGISAYREIKREFAIGDRVQLTAPNRELQVANRDLGVLKDFLCQPRRRVEKISEGQP